MEVSTRWDRMSEVLTVASNANMSSIATLRNTVAFMTCRAINTATVRDKRMHDAVLIVVDLSASAIDVARTMNNVVGIIVMIGNE